VASASKKLKRGSREWLDIKLNAIEAWSGKGARIAAANTWSKIVWIEINEAGFKGADAIERFYKLSNISNQLTDPASKQKINEILATGNIDEISRTAKLLSTEIIKKDIQAQGLTEEKIIELAWSYCTNEKPTGHLIVRRRLRREAKQAVAYIAMALGLIGHAAEIYCTQHSLDMRNDQKTRWDKVLDKIMIVRNGESVRLNKVAKSAHTKRFAELITLTAGLETYALEQGLTWAFITFTAPPHMHSNPKNKHKTWDGSTPRDAHDYIMREYEKAIKRIERLGIVISGLRVAEPHKDGCTHWHAMIFARPEDMASIEKAFRKCNQWRSKEGMDWKQDDGRAKASSYMFKYIEKAIGSTEKLFDEHGRADAWRSTWCIRSFQWIGMPTTQIWKDLRKVKECPNNPLLADMWRAANDGDANAFIRLNGGTNVRRMDRPVKSVTTTDGDNKHIEFIIKATGESIKFDFVKWKQEKATQTASESEQQSAKPETSFD
jgi:hypothetical protein